MESGVRVELETWRFCCASCRSRMGLECVTYGRAAEGGRGDVGKEPQEPLFAPSSSTRSSETRMHFFNRYLQNSTDLLLSGSRLLCINACCPKCCKTWVALIKSRAMKVRLRINSRLNRSLSIRSGKAHRSVLLSSNSLSPCTQTTQLFHNDWNFHRLRPFVLWIEM